MKRCTAIILMVCLLLGMGGIEAKAACSHVDKYGYALYGTILETWREHEYQNILEHYTVEYERFICEGCGEEAVHFTDWFGYHMLDYEGYCIECNCTEDGIPRETVIPPEEPPVIPPQKEACRLSELSDLDYLAFSSIVYESAPDTNDSIQEMLSRKWNSVWDKKPFESKYSNSEITNAEMFDHIKEWRFYDYAENKENGFFAMAFINDHDEIVISFRGSIPLNDGLDWENEEEVNDAVKDWLLNDVAVIFANNGNKYNQMPDAFAFYRKIAMGRTNKQIAVTGHSLGGALADIVSAWSGCYGCTVNAISALDVAYVLWAGQMSQSFTGVDDWNFIDIVNTGDNFGGAYGVKLKPARLYQSDNPGFNIIGTLNHHGINTLVIKNQSNKIVLTPQKSVNVPKAMSWPMKGINRTLQLGSCADDSFNPVQAVTAWGLSMRKWKNMIFLETTSFGGKGNDNITTYYYADTLVGGLGDDQLDGYWGADTYFYNKGDGLDTIYDIHGKDRIYLQGFSTSDEITIVHSSPNAPFAIICCNGEEIIRIYNKRADHILNTLTLQNGLIGEVDITSKLKQPFVSIQGRYEFHCPIDIDILDADGNVVYTLKDSQLGNFYNDYGNFYVLPNEDSQYNSKIIDLFEGYTIKIRGIGEGEMGVLVQDTDNYELLDACGANEVPITPDTVGTLVEDEETGITYLLLDSNGDGTTDETIPLSPVHFEAEDHDSPMELVPGKAPTCVEEGVAQHYLCSCGRTFRDAEAKEEITDPAELVLPATGLHTYVKGKCSLCGEAEPRVPQTGDRMPLYALCVMPVIAAAVLVSTLRRKKKA